MKTIKYHYQSPQYHWVGDGFPVYNFIPGPLGLQGDELSPFIMLDYAAPFEFKPGTHNRGVGEHPHKGFETISIAFEGEVAHKDNHGGGGVIGPGDVQWMTAGSGIMHEEFHSEDFTRNGGKFHFIQLWVNLPAKKKLIDPHYQAITAAQIPQLDLDSNGSYSRLIAGEWLGKTGPAITQSPIVLADTYLKTADTQLNWKFPENWNVHLLVMDGQLEVNGKPVEEKSVISMQAPGTDINIKVNKDAHVLVFGGEPLNEPVARYGPFVMNTEAEIRETLMDFKAGKFGNIHA